MIDYDGFAFPKGSRKVEQIVKGREDDKAERKCREKVDLRDGHRCYFPNCKRISSAKHHVQARSLGGKWISRNILSSCQRHHEWFHAGLIRVVGNPDKGPVKVLLTALGKQAKIRIPKAGVQV